MKLTAPLEIPVELLFDCSKNTVQEYELARLNMAANLQKEMRKLVEMLVDCLTEARFARWMMDNREVLRRTVSLPVGEELFDFGESQQMGAEGGAGSYAADRLRADAAD